MPLFSAPDTINKLNANLHDYKRASIISIYYPTNAHSVKTVELLKRIKIMEATPTCFGLQGNHHQGAIASA